MRRREGPRVLVPPYVLLEMDQHIGSGIQGDSTEAAVHFKIFDAREVFVYIVMNSRLCSDDGCNLVVICGGETVPMLAASACSRRISPLSIWGALVLRANHLIEIITFLREHRNFVRCRLNLCNIGYNDLSRFMSFNGYDSSSSARSSKANSEASPILCSSSLAFANPFVDNISARLGYGTSQRDVRSDG